MNNIALLEEKNGALRHIHPLYVNFVGVKVFWGVGEKTYLTGTINIRLNIGFNNGLNIGLDIGFAIWVPYRVQYWVQYWIEYFLTVIY